MGLDLERLFTGDGLPQIVAEVGANHNRDWNLTIQLLDAIRIAGAEAAKFQSYSADRLYSRDTPPASYLLQSNLIGEGETLHDLIRRIELPIGWSSRLLAECQKRGLTFFSTPFDVQSVDELIKLDVPLLKIASTEITHLPLLEAIAETKRPVVVSTGMATLGDIERVLDVLKHDRVILLQCTVSYPVVPEDVHLRAITTLKNAFGLPVGFSDHTVGHVSAVAAVALGARLLEKHVTISRGLYGPDHPFAAEPADFVQYVSAVREAHLALGDPRKRPVRAEQEFLKYRPGLFAAADLQIGAVLSPANLKVMRRPGSGGIDAMDLPKLVGRRLTRSRKAGEMINWQDF